METFPYAKVGNFASKVGNAATIITTLFEVADIWMSPGNNKVSKSVIATGINFLAFAAAGAATVAIGGVLAPGIAAAAAIVAAGTAIGVAAHYLKKLCYSLLPD